MHPLVSVIQYYDVQFVQQMSNIVCNIVSFSKLDTVFSAGLRTQRMLVTVRGKLAYSSDAETTMNPDHLVAVHPKQKISEGALWVSNWHHVGTLNTETMSDLVSVCAQSLVELVSEHGLCFLISNYACTFCLKCIAHSLELSDLDMPCVDFAHLVFSMSHCSHVFISLVTYCAAWGQQSARKDVQWLTTHNVIAEVMSGRLVLLLNMQGYVERVQSSVELRVLRQDGNVLAQIGKWSRGQLVPFVWLPGAKLESCEDPGVAVQGLISGKLRPYCDDLILGEPEQSKSKRVSPTGLLTHYLVTTYTATAESPSEPPLVRAAEHAARGSLRSSFGLAGSMGSSGSTDFGSNIMVESLPAIYVHAYNDIIYLFAYLQPDQLDRLRDPAGKRLLQDWLVATNLNCALEEMDKNWI